MMKQHLDEAVTTCETLLSHSDKSLDKTDETLPWIEACQTVGNILSSMGFVKESHTWRGMAFDTAPDTAKFYAESSRVYRQCKRWDRAIYFCQRMLDCDPSNTALYRQLANLYHQLEDYKAESRTVYQLLSKQPEQANAAAHHDLGRLLEKQGALTEATLCYQQSIDRDKRFAKAYLALANLWDKQGQLETVIALLQQLVVQVPDAADAHHRLGRAYRQNGQLEAAIDCFRQALQLDPQSQWSYTGLLNSLMQLERWDETIEVCLGISHFVGEFPWAYRFLGNALARKGDLAGAAQAHRQAFDLSGWQACIERGYEFIHNWFLESIPLLERHLLPLNTPENLSVTTRSPLKFLYLGSGDGSAVCWIADEILQRADDQLLCLTAGANERFRQNVARLAEPEKLELKVGDLVAALEALRGESEIDNLGGGGPSGKFDVIFVQVNRKQTERLPQLLSLSWPLLKPDSIMIVKDPLWQQSTKASGASKNGIEPFKASLESCFEQLHRGSQVIFKKVTG